MKYLLPFFEMDENLQNDGLEDFLKKAFDGYEESPSNEVWTGVQSGLVSSTVTTAKTVLLKAWHIAAAAAVVSGLFIGQHFYFQNEMSELAEKLETKTSENEEISAQLNEALFELETAKSNSLNTELPEINTEIPNQKEALVNLGKNVQGSENQFNGIENNTLPISPTNVNSNKDLSIIEIADNTETDEISAESKELLSQKEEEPIDEIREDFKSPSKLNLAELGFVNLGRKDFPLALEIPVREIIPNSKSKGGFYIGANYSRMAAWEKVRSVNGKRPRKNDVQGGPGPSPGGKEDCRFSEITGGNGLAQFFGIMMGYQGNKGWGFETGIHHRNTTITNDHFANVRFEKIDDLNNSGDRFDFDYSLNTPSGEVDIVVRIKDVEPWNKPNKNEEIEFRLTTAQKHTRVSVPLMITYRAGTGIFNLKLRGGTLVNFRLDNSFKVTDAVSSHTKFEFKDLHKVNAEFESLTPISLDFIAGIGMEYDLSNHISFILEPTVISEITSSHIDSFIKSSKFSAGVNAGLIYNF